MEGIKIENIGRAHEELGVNVDSAVEFVREHKDSALTSEKLERARELIQELTEFQSDVDAPEVREAKALLENLVSKSKQSVVEAEAASDLDVETDPEKLKQQLEQLMQNPQ